MYARVTITHTIPDKLEEATGIYRTSVIPALEQRAGYRGAYLLGDRETGKGLSITLWETEADLIAGESGFHQEQVNKFAAMFTAPPVKELYEVSIHGEVEKT